MAITRIIDELIERLQRELQKHEIAGEDIYWDATLLPTEGHAPAAFVTLGIAGPVLGTRIQMGYMIPSPALVPDTELAKLITQGLEVMRTQRSQQLIDQGNPQAAGGLILGK